MGFFALIVVCARNPLHSVLSLIFVFLLSSILVFILEAEFLALSFILIYVGAIAILFLFVVIMLDIKIIDSSFNFVIFNAFFYFLCFTVLFGILVSIPELNFDTSLLNRTYDIFIDWYAELNSLTNAQLLGEILYTYYHNFFLIAGFILFISLIGSLMLTVELNKYVKII